MPKKEKRNKTEISIRGWDYSEIGKILGVNLEKNDDYHTANIRKKLRKLYADLSGFTNITPEKKSDCELKVKQIRYFIVKLCESDHSYVTPLWEGLNKITEDSEYIRYVDLLLPYLWN